MADFSTTTPVPSITSTYTDVLQIINNKFTDLVKGLDTSPTNLPVDSIAWSNAASKWRKWNGTTWADLAAKFAINISGKADTAGIADSVTGGVYITGDQSIDGVKAFVKQIKISSGTATVPSIAFSADGAVDTGLYWTADGYTNFTNNGVYSGSMGPGGNFLVVGNITAYGSITAPSDIRLKTNITKIDNALNRVLQLNGITYDRTDISCNRQTGVIAQEVQKVLPEAVITLTDENQTMTVSYGNMVGLLVEAIKELKAELDTLKTKVN
jgi:hypothetical protein